MKIFREVETPGGGVMKEKRGSVEVLGSGLIS